MTIKITAYKGHRFPEAVISHGVWLYHRFSLSFREVEELLAARGVLVSYEAIRQWCLKFPSTYVKKLRKSAGQPGDAWYLDEVFINVWSIIWKNCGDTHKGRHPGAVALD